MNKIKIKYYRNKMITEAKEKQILTNYIDRMLNCKIN